MRVICKGIGPTPELVEAGRPIVTPEMNASISARRSRTPDTLEQILATVAGMDQGKAVDKIFRHVDFGHASIADMVPVSLDLEGVSLWLIQYVWQLVHTGGGQESSTRYINYTDSAYILPEDAGIDQNIEQYHDTLRSGLAAYQTAFGAWTSIAEKHPELINAPAGATPGVLQRFQKNFVADRSRYWLPLACLNSCNITAWAREWAEIVRTLLGSGWLEAHTLAGHIMSELKLVAPRMLKHCVRKETYSKTWLDEFQEWRLISGVTSRSFEKSMQTGNYESPVTTFLQVNLPLAIKRAPFHQAERLLAEQMSHRENRYDPFGRDVCKTGVEYGWIGVADAEIRDMNRHRPGERETSLVPLGFYGAADQANVVAGLGDCMDEVEMLHRLQFEGAEAVNRSRSKLNEEEFAFIYFANLGTQFTFSHTSTLNKLIYECELRTGRGTHYRYRQHYLDLLDELYGYFPSFKSHILQGQGEPE